MKRGPRTISLLLSGLELVGQCQDLLVEVGVVFAQRHHPPVEGKIARLRRPNPQLALHVADAIFETLEQG